jgi:hypothetical protein
LLPIISDRFAEIYQCINQRQSRLLSFDLSTVEPFPGQT